MRGIAECASAEAYRLHARLPPHTGIVYTPPSYSDHVAVSALLQAGGWDGAAAEGASGAERAEAQPSCIDAGMQPHLRRQRERSAMREWLSGAGGTSAQPQQRAAKPGSASAEAAGAQPTQMKSSAKAARAPKARAGPPAKAQRTGAMDRFVSRSHVAR